MVAQFALKKKLTWKKANWKKANRNLTVCGWFFFFKFWEFNHSFMLVFMCCPNFAWNSSIARDTNLDFALFLSQNFDFEGAHKKF